VIPSSPRRTWALLLGIVLILWLPSLLVPAALEEHPTYLLANTLYQCVLIIAMFWFGPALCNAMVVSEPRDGPARLAVDLAMADLDNRPDISAIRLPVTLFEHFQPFILTAGLLPRHSRVYLSSAFAEETGPAGLRFSLARAMIHGEWGDRLALFIPVLLLTAFFPDLSDWRGWLVLIPVLALWLAVHWWFELRADRKVARILGADAAEGLRETLAASVPGAFLHPPPRWREQAIRA
jgi:hypothetical protein